MMAQAGGRNLLPNPNPNPTPNAAAALHWPFPSRPEASGFLIRNKQANSAAKERLESVLEPSSFL